MTMGTCAQQALPPDPAPLGYAAQVRRKPLGGHGCETRSIMMGKILGRLDNWWETLFFVI